MTNNIQDQIDRLQARIDKLRAKIEVEKPWPQRGDVSFALLSNGNISTFSYAKDLFTLYDQGNLFRTQEEAIKVRERREVEQKMRVIAKGYTWTRGKNNYSLIKYKQYWCIYNEQYKQNQGSIHFATRKDANQALALGEAELDKLL
jgi:hypothetical protein